MSQRSTNNTRALTEHFFREEYSKMVSVISRYFGPGSLQYAEDIVQDTLLEAITNWEYKGIPANPQAWLYTVAKNKTLNLLNRQKYFDKYLALRNEVKHVFDDADGLSFENTFKDDQLRLMFACCHPLITSESQTTLILKTLCGFSIKEISRAFLSKEEAINKRLVRARKILRDNKVEFDLPGKDELEERLETVLGTIYLIFNEGYSASIGDKLIRYELCLEAIRLATIILDCGIFKNHSTVHALVALMLLDASRFEARSGSGGEFIPMKLQDREKWDQHLVTLGIRHLSQITTSTGLSRYHILATISAYHCTAQDYTSTEWSKILALYDSLLTIEYSPVVLLNRAIVISEIRGVGSAVDELKKLEKPLKDYYLFYSTLGEFYLELNKFKDAKECFHKAISKTENATENKFLMSKLDRCQDF